VSVRICWTITGNNGFPVSPATVTLSDPTGAYGVRRLDTLAVVVAAGTAMTDEGNGVWAKTFTEPATGLEYEYYVKITETSPAANNYYINGRVSGTAAAFDPQTLAGVRRLWVLRSGDYSLVRDAENNDFTDSGIANIIINEAQRWLDRRIPHHKTVAQLYKTLAADESMITFSQARYVKGVYDITDGVKTAIDWATLYVGLAPDHADVEDEDDLPEAQNVVFGNHWPTHAVYVDPTDTERTILVEAAWYCPTLVDDTDKSFWTVQHPVLLARAAALQNEMDFRNSAGVRDYASVLDDDLKNIYHDLIAEEAAGPHTRWRMNS